MAEDDKQKIWICLGDVKNVPLSVRQSDIDVYRKAEQSVNKLWLITAELLVNMPEAWLSAVSRLG